MAQDCGEYREPAGAAPQKLKRRFPPPWSVEEQSPCYAVRDFDGQALGYGYFEDEPGRRCVRKTLSKRISEN
jgi:hypothetical protein